MPTLLVEATTGATSAVIANAFVYPLDILTSRVQVTSKNQKIKSKKEIIVALLKKKGFFGLYTGMNISLVQTFLSSFGYFWVYSLVKKLYNRYQNAPNTYMELFLGALAGGISRAFTTPISVVQMRKQCEQEDSSYQAIVGNILKEDGITGFWRGFGASLILTVNPAITYGLFERLQALKPSRLTPREVFVLGAFTKSLATIVTYPYILAKAKLQGGHDSVSIGKCLKQEINAYGVGGLYRGLSVQLSKSVLTQSILFLIRDHLSKLYAIFLKQ
jgi:hypothetical protein